MRSACAAVRIVEAAADEEGQGIEATRNNES